MLAATVGLLAALFTGVLLAASDGVAGTAPAAQVPPQTVGKYAIAWRTSDTVHQGDWTRQMTQVASFRPAVFEIGHPAPSEYTGSLYSPGRVTTTFHFDGPGCNASKSLVHSQEVRLDTDLHPTWSPSKHAYPGDVQIYSEDSTDAPLDFGKLCPALAGSDSSASGWVIKENLPGRVAADYGDDAEGAQFHWALEGRQTLGHLGYPLDLLHAGKSFTIKKSRKLLAPCHCGSYEQISFQLDVKRVG